ncbi:MAG: right-handed parallel beta-helix repeat-containing protein, partial [Planctomycetota bacterium]
PQDCRIANNWVHACGIEYHGAVGIWVGFAQRAVIAHNRVHDLPYTGISVGWQWNPRPTPCRENRIEANHIFDVMQRLGDGGGIYTLGFQPGTVLRGNHIHDVRRSRFNQAAPNNGMFIDEGSKGFLFERNVIYATAHQAVRHNQNRPEWHTWRDNHFGDAHKAEAAAQQIVAAAGLQPPHRARLLGGE